MFCAVGAAARTLLGVNEGKEVKSKRKKPPIRVRKNFTMHPLAFKVLEKLSRDMGLSMSRVLEASLGALSDARRAEAAYSAIVTAEHQRGLERHLSLEKSVSDYPKTWDEANALLDSLPTVEKKL